MIINLVFYREISIVDFIKEILSDFGIVIFGETYTYLFFGYI